MHFVWSDSYPIVKRPGVNALRHTFAQTTSGGSLMHSRWNWTSVNVSDYWNHICKSYSSQNVKIINVWERVIGYITLSSDMTALMQQASPGTSSLASIQQADAQTAANETESKTQMLNSKSSSLKVVRQIYLSSADAACSHVAFFELEMSWKWIKCSFLSLDFLT